MRPKLEFVPRQVRTLKQATGLFNQEPEGLSQSLFDFLSQDFSLDEYLEVDNPAIYMIRQKGEAMQPRIHSGDVMVVNRSIKAKSGDIVVALVHGQFCVRRFFPHDNNQGEIHVELMADQEKYRSYHLSPGIPFEVWGVVTHVLGKMK
ncbi:MAG: LexA family protein [Bacteriovoracaceae bacterium]